MAAALPSFNSLPRDSYSGVNPKPDPWCKYSPLLNEVGKIVYMHPLSIPISEIQSQIEKIESLQKKLFDAKNDTVVSKEKKHELLKQKLSDAHRGVSLYNNHLKTVGLCLAEKTIPMLPSQITFHPSFFDILEKICFEGRSITSCGEVEKGGYGSISRIKIGDMNFVVKKPLTGDLTDEKIRKVQKIQLHELATSFSLAQTNDYFQLIFAFPQESSVEIVYPEGKQDLQMFIDSGASLSIEDMRSILFDLLEQLTELHTMKFVGKNGKLGEGVVHNDVNLPNILLREEEDGRLRAQLIDFGLTTLVGQSQNSGTRRYMAPEKAFDSIARTENDIWSFGIIGFTILARCFPFSIDFIKSSAFQSQEKIDEAFAALFKYKQVRDNVTKFDPDGHFKDLIKRCLQLDPKKRPSAKDLLEHRFFASLSPCRKKEEKAPIYANPQRFQRIVTGPETPPGEILCESPFSTGSSSSAFATAASGAASSAAAASSFSAHTVSASSCASASGAASSAAAANS